MRLYQARYIAQQLVEELKPYCSTIEIAGSIRREKPEVKDIEIVCVPKGPVETGLFQDDFAKAVNRYQKVKGEPDGKYTQRLIPIGNNNYIKLDLFMARPENFGLIYLIRTGSSAFSAWVAKQALKRRCKMENGSFFMQQSTGHFKQMNIRAEQDLFNLLDIPPVYKDPTNRNWIG